MVSRIADSLQLASSSTRQHAPRATRSAARQTPSTTHPRAHTPEPVDKESDGEYLPEDEQDDGLFLPMAPVVVLPTASPSHAGLMDSFIDSHRQGSERARSAVSEADTETSWGPILEQTHPHRYLQPASRPSLARSHSQQQTPSRPNSSGYYPSASPSPRFAKQAAWNGINPMVALPPKPWSPPGQDPAAVFTTPSAGALGRVLLPAASGGMLPVQSAAYASSSPARSASATSASFSSGGSSYQLSGGFGRRQRQRYSMPQDDEDDDHADDSSPTKSFHGQGEWRRAPNPPPPPSLAYPTPPMTESASQGAEKPPEGLPAGPRSSDKPSFSYAAIIGQAILASSKGRLSLAEIYAWISAAFPYYKKGDAGWMNSIRHNLSLNKCFVKVERQKGDPNGKGMLWMIKEGTEHQFDGGGFRKRPLASSKTDSGDKNRKREKEKRDTKALTDALAVLCPDPSQPLNHAHAQAAKRKLQEEPVFGDSGVKTGGLFKRPALEKSTTWHQPLAPPPVPVRRASLPPARPQRACAANASFVDLASDDAGVLGHDDDDFVTPRKAPEDTAIPSSVLASAHLPHLTPSVSSPISSPGPHTISRHGHSHLGRSHLSEVEAQVHTIPSSDADAEGEADEDVDAVVLQLKDDNHTISPAAVFARLKPGFEFKPPSTRPPASPPRSKHTEHATLSPIARVRSDHRPSLPGPNNLLASSPIISRHRRGLSSTGDLASHALNLMRPPESPVSRSSAAHSVNRLATPKSLMNPSHQSGSPLRTPAGPLAYNLVSQSPFGAALLQHRAEQGRGANDSLFGDDTDLLDPFCSALAVQDELQHMSSLFQSPSRAAPKWGFEGSPMGAPRTSAVDQSP